MTSLVALDIDGTLLEHDGTLPPERAAAVDALVAAGLPTVLVTGKTWPSIRWLLRRMPLPGPHVCCNGAAVLTADEHLLSVAALPDVVVNEVSAVLEERGLPQAHYLDDGSILTPRADPRLEVLVTLGEPRPEPQERGTRRVLKILTVVAPEREDGLRAHGRQARIQRTSPRFLEWSPAGVDKGTGLAEVARRLDVALDGAVAVGDAESDLAMFAVAGTGVAVADAPPDVTAGADVHLRTDVADFLRALARDALR